MTHRYNIITSLGVAFALIAGAIFTSSPVPNASASLLNENCICTHVYAPVCGVDGKTYGNSCLAQCAEMPIAHQGECGQTTPTPKPTRVPSRFPKSITTTVTQTQISWTRVPVTLQQDINFQMTGPSSVIQATERQGIFGTGRLYQQQSISGTMHWSYPFFTWSSFNW